MLTMDHMDVKQKEYTLSPRRQRGFVHLPILDAIEEFEDLISDRKNTNWTAVSKQEGISTDDPRYEELGQLFKSVKYRTAESAVLTICRFDEPTDEMKEEESPRSTTIQYVDWATMIYIEEDEKSDSEILSLTGNASEFRNDVQEKLMDELFDYEDKIQPKSENDLSIETGNEICCHAQNGNEHSFDLIQEQCPCFQRIHIVMESYHRLLRDDELWNTMTISQVIQSDQYGHKQLMDDFLHILSIHMDADGELDGKYDESLSIGQQMALYFMDTFPCGDCPGDMDKCKAIGRHFRARQPSSAINANSERDDLRRLFRTINAEDIVFQEECDKIHGYFLQFGILHLIHIAILVVLIFRSMYSSTTHLGTNATIPEVSTTEKAESKEEDNGPATCQDDACKVYEAIDENAKGRSFSRIPSEPLQGPEPIALKATSSYIGETEDNEWWKDVPAKDNPMQHKLQHHEDDTDRKQKNEEIYNTLLAGMATFRYQNA